MKMFISLSVSLIPLLINRGQPEHDISSSDSSETFRESIGRFSINVNVNTKLIRAQSRQQFLIFISEIILTYLTFWTVIIKFMPSFFSKCVVFLISQKNSFTSYGYCLILMHRKLSLSKWNLLWLNYRLIIRNVVLQDYLKQQFFYIDSIRRENV